MKRLGIFLMSLIVLGACTNKKVVEYNSERIGVMEKYLNQNKLIKTSKDYDKLAKEGKITIKTEHKSLEKEAELWKEKSEK